MQLNPTFEWEVEKLGGKSAYYLILKFQFINIKK